MAYRIKSVLELFGLLWFVLGNYWTFKTDDCVGTPLFNLSISYVILGYIYLLLPLVRACLSTGLDSIWLFFQVLNECQIHFVLFWVCRT
jgi:hypothetical protein